MLIMVITAALDAAALIYSSAFTASTTGADLTSEEELVRIVKNMAALGFGQTLPQLVLVPLMPFYSYSRVPKSKTFGLLIPVIGIALMVLVVLECGYQGIRSYLPILQARMVESASSPEAVEVMDMIMTAVP